MTAILLALGSSDGYGVSDFLASRVARRIVPVLLVLYSQALQSVVLLVVVVVAVRQPYSGGGLGWGAVAGAAGAAGLVAYYQALAWPAGSGRARWPWAAWCWCWSGSP